MNPLKAFTCTAIVVSVLTLVAQASAQGQQQPIPRFETKTEVTVSVTVPQSKTPGEYLLSFNTPVGLPGVSLGIGTYMFRYVGNSRNAIQVLSADGKKIYGMFLPAQITRLEKIDQQAVWLIDPALEGAPRRIQAWFEPGRSIGAEFLYIRGLLGATQ